MKMACLIAGVLAGIPLCGCNSPTPAQTDAATAAPEAHEKAKLDTAAWSISDPQISPMDGTKTQFISAGQIGSEVVLCFENGKLCGGKHAGAYISSPCWVDGEEDHNYERRVRIKFDDEKPLVQMWGITDDHKAIFPHSAKAFYTNLKEHRSLMVEFGCARWDNDVVTYDIHGLKEALQTAGLER